MQDGTYYGEIVGASVTESRKSKTPQVSIKFRVTHVAADDGKWVSLPNLVERTVHLSLHEKMKDTTEDRLTALGFGGYATMTFTGSGAELALTHHEKYGEQWDLAGGGGEPDALDATKVAELDALWQAKHPAKPTAITPPPAAPSPPISPGSPTGDGVPF